ncbi:helix-turn-helix domain-containing protein [Symbiopectobacterium purcellii]|uniref:Helix-turn-helix domain-containing protein n=1 Tax=Symbiopectobacterium purcellii TaxID=2871826 RepID=A0ABX9AH81_9ENTR|nr:helix-turn-helix domain-containing protein [Symbiopectobacterium purcellii]QZN94517.1 helix-turn-helix domain-containing protein [Symbiopectobacterium purcellii]
MKSIFTTQDIPDPERFGAFRDIVKGHFLSSYDCCITAPPAQSRFYANLAERRVLDLQFVQLESNSHSAASKPRPQGISQEGDFYIELQRFGTSRLSQDGRTAFLRQGDFCFFDMSRPVSWSFDDDYSLYKILIPRDKFSNRLGNTQNLTAKAIRSNSVIGALVYSFILKYVPFLDSIPPLHAQHLADILLNLIATSLSELSMAAPAQSMGQSTLFYIAQHYLEKHLSDPQLSVTACASACGISVRSLQKLFQEQGTSVNRWVHQQRLERYKTALTNPLMADKNITQLAYDCGFNDISNLSRRFKAEFMVTPSEYRKMHAVRRPHRATAIV